jgi:hypothetical protein
MKDSSKLQAAHDYWRSRRVVFHSWRHYFAARMADRLEKRKVMLAGARPTMDARTTTTTIRFLTLCPPRPLPFYILTAATNRS